jgi:uracil-DNA glycosylase family 4
MIKKTINQNDKYDQELLKTFNQNYIFDNSPIKRIKDKVQNATNQPNNKVEYLDRLKNEINSIENCNLKKNARQIIFGDGNVDSPLMMIGGVPGEKEDLDGKTYSGEDGKLLEKMLLAINIKKKDIYTTYAVNFRPQNDRKPSTEEIKRYSLHLQKHIAIINPKLIILMGSTAMEALTGLNNKISDERGKWKEVIIKNTNYNVIITFNPSYLLRIPENKKYSWEDLKKIKKKIKDLNLNI